jgi:hypothetical protein
VLNFGIINILQMKLKIFSTLLTLSLFFTNIFSQTFQEADSVVYKRKDANIMAVYPANYMISENISDTSHNIDVYCEFNFLKYNLSINFHNDSLPEPYLLSKVSVKSFIDATEGEVLSSEDFYVDSTKGFKAHIKLPQENFEIIYFAFIKDKIQYQAYVLFRKELYDEENIDNFINSISFIK